MILVHVSEKNRLLNYIESYLLWLINYISIVIYANSSGWNGEIQRDISIEFLYIEVGKQQWVYPMVSMISVL